MGRRSVDNLTLERWRVLDALWVLEKLRCYSKADNTFEALSAQSTQRYYSNAEGQNFELLLRAPKFFDTRLQCGVDLVMHVRHLDFKGTTDLPRRLAV